MKNQGKYLLLLLVLVMGLVACGTLSEPEEASAPIEAATLDTSSSTDAAALRTYQISSTDSTVTFALDEELMGQPKTVVGTTNQVAGEIAVNLADLSTAQVGVIQINARGLTTDNNMRTRTMQNRILETGEFEFITFTPTLVNGLPASAVVGESVSFTISGDLTIRDITQPVVFNVTATVVSETQLSGTATAIVNRGDFDLQIPSVPNVANVEEEVELTIEFIANAS
ncbi:MAG: YceI family protein [Chloroflexi bacterium]|nr:YceI family protein [Chloroflexota bacterium]